MKSQQHDELKRLSVTLALGVIGAACILLGVRNAPKGNGAWSPNAPVASTIPVIEVAKSEAEAESLDCIYRNGGHETQFKTENVRNVQKDEQDEDDETNE